MMDLRRETKGFGSYYAIQDLSVSDRLKLMTGVSNWHAPMIFKTRDWARKTAREWREAGFRVRVVKIKLSIEIQLEAP